MLPSNLFISFRKVSPGCADFLVFFSTKWLDHATLTITVSRLSSTCGGTHMAFTYGLAEHACGACAGTFLEGVAAALAETKQARMEQPSLFLRMHMAQYQLAAGNVDACKAAVSGAKDELDHLTDVRPPCC